MRGQRKRNACPSFLILVFLISHVQQYATMHDVLWFKAERFPTGGLAGPMGIARIYQLSVGALSSRKSTGSVYKEAGRSIVVSCARVPSVYVCPLVTPYN